MLADSNGTPFPPLPAPSFAEITDGSRHVVDLLSNAGLSNAEEQNEATYPERYKAQLHARAVYFLLAAMRGPDVDACGESEAMKERYTKPLRSYMMGKAFGLAWPTNYSRYYDHHPLTRELALQLRDEAWSLRSRRQFQPYAHYLRHVAQGWEALCYLEGYIDQPEF